MKKHCDMTNTDTSPTFIGVGAARSGTTSLYIWLKQHPQVFMSPVKETNYFAELQPTLKGPGDDAILNRPIQRVGRQIIEERHCAIISSWKDYLGLFSGAEQYLARGEISPSYLYYSNAAFNIKSRLPRIKIIILLRDPVERTFSNYKKLVLSGREYLNFRQALDAEEERLAQNWEHFWALKGLSLYAEQIRRYLDLFPREQLGIWLYEDLRKDPRRVYQEICRFLDIDPNIQVEFSRENNSGSTTGFARWFASRVPAVRTVIRTVLPSTIRSALVQLDRGILTKPIRMTSADREYLLTFFREDILALNQMLPELNVTRWIIAQEEKLKSDDK